MDLDFTKQVADPIHNTISLTETEVEIVESPVFQRLRHVMQLGMVDRVFPGANYSRFSHSLGVCHVAGQIMESLKASGADIDKTMVKRYRLAGLLHDIGHYPFSHATEAAIDNAQEKLPGQTRSHDEVGRLIVEHDPGISEIFERSEFDPNIIADIFCRESDEDPIATPPNRLQYVDVVSSGLDADRLDHLRRTSHHSGVPYGSVNFDYLISQFELDQANSNVCLSARALNAADHFLMSRWFERQQVIFHKTVQAASTTLRELLQILIQRDADDLTADEEPTGPHLACTEEQIIYMAENGLWEKLDDPYVLQRIRALHDGSEDPIHRKCEAVLERRFPKTVFEHSSFDNHERARKGVAVANAVHEKYEDGEIIEDGEIGQGYWSWGKVSDSITGIEAREKEDSKRTDHQKYPLRILKPEEETAYLITDLPESICSIHAGRVRTTKRLFVLFPKEDGEDLRSQIEENIQDITDGVETTTESAPQEAEG